MAVRSSEKLQAFVAREVRSAARAAALREHGDEVIDEYLAKAGVEP